LACAFFSWELVCIMPVLAGGIRKLVGGVMLIALCLVGLAIRRRDYGKQLSQMMRGMGAGWVINVVVAVWLIWRGRQSKSHGLA
jgi:hypothetical protein